MDRAKLSQIEGNLRGLDLPEKLWLMEWLARSIRNRTLREQSSVGYRAPLVAPLLDVTQSGSRTQAEIITCDHDIMSGMPVFSGTRVPVQSLIDHLKAGDTVEDFLDGFPSVTREQAERFLEIALQAVLVEAEYARVA